jgi:hypothetical protein
MGTAEAEVVCAGSGVSAVFVWPSGWLVFGRPLQAVIKSTYKIINRLTPKTLMSPSFPGLNNPNIPQITKITLDEDYI